MGSFFPNVYTELSHMMRQRIICLRAAASAALEGAVGQPYQSREVVGMPAVLSGKLPSVAV
jgi:hypothetical protein